MYLPSRSLSAQWPRTGTPVMCVSKLCMRSRNLLNAIGHALLHFISFVLKYVFLNIHFLSRKVNLAINM